ncbi:MAG: response regulator transcription factor [Prolixibacteraceae bacterium]|nr:response regulator transcription factor [Prolixibacteraceae bacterium]
MEQKAEYTCLIIDDEPIAIRVLESYVERLGPLKLLASYTNALDAMQTLHTQHIDLLFLDIQMPGINGLEFFGSIKQAPQVIFTTAYRNYAADAFDLDALDYLLKPISFERFLKAINKFLDQQAIAPKKEHGDEKREFIVVKSNKKNHKININDIRYVESLDDYVKIHLQHKTLVCYLRLAALEKEINHPAIMRVHRSFLINLTHVAVFTHYEIDVAGTRIPVGRKYRPATIQKLSERNES